MGKSSTWPQTFAALSASLSLLCSGFHFGWETPSILELYEQFGQFQIWWMISLIFIGGICGTLLGLVLVESCGRKTTLLITTVPFVSSCLLIVFARNFWWLYLARLVAGIGIGVAVMVTPMYIGEIAESRIRGSLCVLMPVMLNVGYLVPQLIGPWVAVHALGIVGAIIPIVFATSLIWIPESPYYYFMKRNPAETRKSIAWLRGTSDVNQEVQQIGNSIALNQRRGIHFLDLFAVPSNRKALLVMIVLLIAEILSGWMIISLHSIQLVIIPGIEGLESIVIRSAQLVTSFCVVFLVDKVGRRPLLLTSVSLCLIFLLAAASLGYLNDTVTNIPGIFWLSVAASVGYAISYSIGVGTLPIVIAAEIFPCEVKAFAMALFTAFFFAVKFGVSKFVIAISFNFKYFIVLYFFVACNFVCTILIYFVVPETKGRRLNEIQVAFQGHFQTQF